MTQHTTDMPADTTTTDPIDDSPTGTFDDGHRRKEVSTMARKSRAGGKRAWDEMSETDRRVLLETVRMRREAQVARDVRGLESFGQRINR